MNEKLTEMVFILDASGSMSGLESDTVGGFNSMVEKQKAEEGEALVSLVTFSNASRVILDRAPVSSVEPLTQKDYFASGCTALMDALGDAIHHIGNVHKYAREEDRPAHTVFVITTDGMENASRRWSSDEVKRLITRQREKYGWEFLFFAANIDAVESAARIGIHADRAVGFENDGRGIGVNYGALSDAITSMRQCGAIDPGWSAPIEADKKARAPRKPRVNK